MCVCLKMSVYVSVNCMDVDVHRCESSVSVSVSVGRVWAVPPRTGSVMDLGQVHRGWNIEGKSGYR